MRRHHLFDLIGGSPKTATKTGGKRGAQPRQLRGLAPQHLPVEDVGLKLHQPVVFARPAIGQQGFKPRAGTFHGIEHIFHLKSDRFEGGPDHVFLARVE